MLLFAGFGRQSWVKWHKNAYNSIFFEINICKNVRKVYFPLAIIRVLLYNIRRFLGVCLFVPSRQLTPMISVHPLFINSGRNYTMKKTLSLILAALMTVSMAAAVSAHEEVTTAVFGTPEAIDGIKDAAWDGAQFIEPNDLAENSTDLGEEASTTKVWSMWDGEFLYFYAEVMDITPDAEVKPDAHWDQDALSGSCTPSTPTCAACR